VSYTDNTSKLYEVYGEYYQPALVDGELPEGQLTSFDVYHSKEACRDSFPDCEIKTFSGGDIEGPRFVDHTPVVVWVPARDRPERRDWDLRTFLLDSVAAAHSFFTVMDRRGQPVKVVGQK